MCYTGPVQSHPGLFLPPGRSRGPCGAASGASLCGVGPFDSHTMATTVPAAFEVHWSTVQPDAGRGQASPGCRLLAIWPAPVNHDACFEAAGFTLFDDNDEAWDGATEALLQRLLDALCKWGTPQLASKPLRYDPPWYLRLFREGQQLPLAQQALYPMLLDSLPSFRARFGQSGAALQTGNGHFLFWVSLPETGPDASGFVRSVAGPWPVVETGLRWSVLLPDPAHSDDM